MGSGSKVNILLFDARRENMTPLEAIGPFLAERCGQ